LATVLPSTCTVSSPRFPFTTSTSTPGSFRNASAKLAACARVPAQVGHSRMVIFFIAGPAPIMIRLHPLGTTSLSRVSRLPPLVVILIHYPYYNRHPMRRKGPRVERARSTSQLTWPKPNTRATGGKVATPKL
jgi:hypothetical protein